MVNKEQKIKHSQEIVKRAAWPKVAIIVLNWNGWGGWYCWKRQMQEFLVTYLDYKEKSSNAS